MAYFLKKANQANNTYLAIYESYYSPEVKGTKHKCYKSLGSVTSLKKKGIEDPVSFYQAEVDKLNLERKSGEEKTRYISDKSPIRYLGYFPLDAVMRKLNMKKYIDFFKLSTSFDYDLYDILCALVYARSVKPCSKYRTFHEVIPYLYREYNFSYDQILSALNFYGNDYEKFIELFTAQVKDIYPIDTSLTYFDCTNFYFEIDREDDFRKKGPSKENRKDPIIGLGLLLDANQIPVGMKLYPGNESEKPVMREVIDSLKSQNNIEGRTIHVADKGLNCAKNIYFARQNNDGYLFSKSVKQLPEKEKEWVLLPNDYKNVKDKDGKILYSYKSCIDRFPYIYEDENGEKHTFELTEKRLVTYNPDLAAKKRYEINRMVEKAKGLCLSRAKRNEYGEASKYVTFSSTSKGKITDGKVKVTINEKAIEEDLKLAGYNLLATSEIKMKDIDIYSTYHNLWRIEESFRIMKTDLDARPVYLQKENTIKGHFFICYITVLLERIFQFIELNNEYSSNDILHFFKEFKVVKDEHININISVSNDFIKALAEKTKLPILNSRLNEKQIKKVLEYRL